MLDLDAIKGRLASATPGPWEPAELQGQSRRNSFFSVAVVGRWEVRAGIPCQAQPDECDADLIAHAPQDLGALVAEVERLRAAIRQYGRDTDGARNPREFGLAYARLLEAFDA